MLDSTSDAHTTMSGTLALQRAAQRAAPYPDAAERIDRIKRAIAVLVDHRGALEAAMNEDFAGRSADLSAFADIAPAVNALHHARRQVKKWMKPEKRSTEFPLNLTGASSQVFFQPKGVVGIMAPWNFPVNLVFGPLAGVLAAGNRAMVKPSELTPRTSDLMREALNKTFTADEIDVVTGDADIGAAFSALPFDHLIFTGSTTVGRYVMQAAAKNLTPVTLELGGKSPVIVGKSADIERAATRVIHGKTFNAGQVCIAPDYVLLPKKDEQAFVKAAKSAALAMYPNGFATGEDYTSIISPRHFTRMNALLADAKAKGATIVPLALESDVEDAQSHQRTPPTIVLNTIPDMDVMREEVFGPLLPVVTYDDVSDAIGRINSDGRPLALYYFGDDKREEAKVLTQTTAGGVTINDTIMHISQDDLPFGGVGSSGMGHYHGHDGFREFSHQKSVFRQGPFDMLKALRPPFGGMFKAFVDSKIKK